MFDLLKEKFNESRPLSTSNKTTKTLTAKVRELNFCSFKSKLKVLLDRKITVIIHLCKKTFYITFTFLDFHTFRYFYKLTFSLTKIHNS